MKYIVIGGSKLTSIGGQAALTLANAGHYVLAPSSNEVDVTDVGACKEFFDQHPDADGLLLSHGRTLMAPFAEAEPEAVARVWHTNVLGTMFAAQAYVQAVERKYATVASTPTRRIVIIGSMGGSRVFTNSSAYCASKAAVRHLVECMAWELEPRYEVIGINPGNVSGTGMAESIIAAGVERERFETHAKRGGIPTHREIGMLAAKVLSDPQLSWASGSNIDLPGGAR